MAISIDVALSRQIALQTQLDIVANNIANQGNVGFEDDQVIFDEYINSQGIKESTSYTDDITTYRDTRLGGVMTTGNPLHLARQGKGYFGIQTPQGIRYTGNGAFTRSPDGVLVDQMGNPVLSMDGGDIVIPAEVSDLLISSDGTISDVNGVIARVGLFDFENPYLLKKEGDNMMQTDQAAIPLEADATLIQRAVNDSNGNPMKNTTQLIEITKAYAMNQKMIEQQLSLESKSIDQLITLASAA